MMTASMPQVRISSGMKYFRLARLDSDSMLRSSGDVGEDAVHRHPEEVHYPSGIDPDEDGDHAERDQGEELAPVDLRQGLVLLVQGAEEHPLQGPEQVGRAEDDARGGHDRDPAIAAEGAEEDQHLAPETREPRQPERGEEREGGDAG